jgi:hypothetical protein
MMELSLLKASSSYHILESVFCLKRAYHIWMKPVFMKELVPWPVYFLKEN